VRLAQGSNYVMPSGICNAWACAWRIPIGMRSGAARLATGALARLALIGTSLALVLLLLEGVVRVAVPQWPSLVPQRFLTTTPSGALAGVPNFDGRVASLFGDFDVPVQLDSRGFRNPPGADPTAPLAFVGDSFCFGWGLLPEQSFSYLVARRLGVPSYNFCTVGADLVDDLRTVQTWMPPAPARTTVLLVTFENDVLAYPAVLEGVPSDTVRGLSRGAVSRWLMTDSALFNVTTTLARQSALMVALVRRLGLVSGVPAIAEDGIDPIAASTQVIQRIERACGGRRFLVVLVPPRPGQVALVDYGAFVRALRQAGFDVIDPSEVPGLTVTTIPRDGHWDATMNAAIAPVIAQHLARTAAS